MVFKIVRTTQFEHDLDIIHDHLIDSYLTLGEALADAFDHAEARIKTIETDMEALVHAPYQGTLWPEITTGLRHVTKNRAILYFKIDETHQIILVLAVFFGGQDHEQHILDRFRPAT